MPDIDIALPTYNCAGWLDVLMESILRQDMENWRIVTRDDASTDDTAARMAMWRERLGDRMMVLPRGPNLGPVGNYDAILSATTAKWVMLADSDDVWKPGKIARTLEAMRTGEESQAGSTPALVFADAEVVDQQLRPVAASYWQWSRANLRAADVFHRLIVDCPAISSTMMVNRALLDLALPMTGAAYSQDWWLMLVAAAFGTTIQLQAQTVLYRRHSSNDSLEPYAATTKGAVHRFLEAPDSARRKVNRLIEQFAPQAGAFARRFREKLATADLAALEAASRLPNAGGMQRRLEVARHDLWFGSAIKNVGLMLFL